MIWGRKIEMHNSFLICVIVLLMSVFMASISQVILKKSTFKHYDSVIREYINLPVILAYSIFLIATTMTVFAYSAIPLSLGIALDTTSYLYITFFGVVIFKEKLTKQKVFSLALIILGILIYALV